MSERTIWILVIIFWTSVNALWIGHEIYLNMDWDRAVAAGEIIPNAMPTL